MNIVLYTHENNSGSKEIETYWELDSVFNKSTP